MPPIAHRLVADVDTTFEHDVFDLAQRQRIADVHHHRETDDLGRAVKITKGMVHYHRLREVPFQLNPIFSDNAYPRHASKNPKPTAYSKITSAATMPFPIANRITKR